MPPKVCIAEAMVFPVVMYGCVELEHKKGWALKNWCFGTVVLQKTSESPSDSKEIKPVNPKGNQPWIYIGKNEAEAPIFCHLMQRASSLEKTLMLERLKAWGQGGIRGWDGWMPSPTQWTWIWANFGNWQWTGRPDMLQSLGSQRVGHDWVSELKRRKRNAHLLSPASLTWALSHPWPLSRRGCPRWTGWGTDSRQGAGNRAPPNLYCLVCLAGNRVPGT